MGALCCLWLMRSDYLSLLIVFWALPLLLLAPESGLDYEVTGISFPAALAEAAC